MIISFRSEVMNGKKLCNLFIVLFSFILISISYIHADDGNGSPSGVNTSIDDGNKVTPILEENQIETDKVDGNQENQNENINSNNQSNDSKSNEKETIDSNKTDNDQDSNNADNSKTSIPNNNEKETVNNTEDVDSESDSIEPNDSKDSETDLETEENLEKNGISTVIEDLGLDIDYEIYRLDQSIPVMYDPRESETIDSPYNNINVNDIKASRSISVKNKTYYLLIDVKNNMAIGWVEEKAVGLIKIVENNINRYLTLTKGQYEVVTDLKARKASDASVNYGMTYLINTKYLVDGKYYYSLETFDKKKVGYVSSKFNGINLEKKPTGSKINTKGYITINSSSYVSWKNMDWVKLKNASEIKNRTFVMKDYYVHYNGKKFVSLYDSRGKFYGYVNLEAGETSEIITGKSYSINYYYTVNSNSFVTWKSMKWDKLHNASSVNLKTFYVKEAFSHANGNAYYSLYDSNGKFHGYINKDALVRTNVNKVTNFSDRFVRVNSRSYQTFKSFAWQKLYDAREVYGRTFRVKQEYSFIVGNKFLALYDTKGKFYGFINDKATSSNTKPEGNSIKETRYVTVRTKSYTTWKSMKWDKLYAGSSVYNKNFQVRDKYNHSNGETYYSLYDSNGKFFGYINAKAVRDFSSWSISNGMIRTNNGKNFQLRNGNFIIVSLKNQRLWGVQKEKIVVDTPIISGKPGSPTVTGNFKIEWGKTRNTYLIGANYRSHVSYWIPFTSDNMYGIHDSSWQWNGYGGNLYKLGFGSHGCVNTPISAMRTLYDAFPKGTQVIVY